MIVIKTHLQKSWDWASPKRRNHPANVAKCFDKISQKVFWEKRPSKDTNNFKTFTKFLDISAFYNTWSCCIWAALTTWSDFAADEMVERKRCYSCHYFYYLLISLMYVIYVHCVKSISVCNANSLTISDEIMRFFPCVRFIGNLCDITRSDPRQRKIPFKQRALHSLITCSIKKKVFQKIWKDSIFAP